jgi:hypothetical protein
VKWLAPLLITAAIAGLSASHVWAFYSGKKAERQVQEIKTAQALIRAASEAERIREHDLELAMGVRDREIRIVERIREVRVDVPTPNCERLGSDWVLEANKAVSAASRTKRSPNSLR